MLKTLVGDDGYAKALDLYFDRHDGQACTIEDWLQVFEDACVEDLSQFKLWYSQSGTPILNVSEEWDAEKGIFTITVHQRTEPSPNQKAKKPLRMDVRFTLLDTEGAVIDYVGERKYFIDKTEHKVPIHNLGHLTDKPILSFNRGFSAPVIVEHKQTKDERLTLFAHDTDPFNRWEAGRGLAKDQLIDMIVEDAAPDPAYLDALGTSWAMTRWTRHFAHSRWACRPKMIWHNPCTKAGAHRIRCASMAAAKPFSRQSPKPTNPLSRVFMTRWRSPAPTAPMRRMRGGGLCGWLHLKRCRGTDGDQRAQDLFAKTDNMTERLGALAALFRHGDGSTASRAFHETFQHDPNVMDKWFALQISCAKPEDALHRARMMTDHADFNWKTPNRFRAVIGAFVGNTAGFHAADGSGYDFVAHWLGKLDPVNPMTAARMATVFETWARYDGDRQGQMRDAVKRLLNGSPSRDMTEIATRILG